MTSDPEARELVLTVRAKKEIADGVFLFELRAPDGATLPPFTPGSHITVTAPSGQKRRYSLCNDAAEPDRYLIAVKQESSGRGGSLSFTRDIKEGDAITIEPPANEFEMAKSEPKSFVFIAGGIGITPIRAMILHCIRHGRHNFKLYYFTRTPEAMAFRQEFGASEFTGKVILHHDNGDAEQINPLYLDEPNVASVRTERRPASGSFDGHAALDESAPLIPLMGARGQRARLSGPPRASR